MSTPPKKFSHYKAMIERMKAARPAGFHLEASWYAYAIVEDRLVSILHNSGGAYEKPGRLFRNMGRKIGIVLKRKKKDSLLEAYFPDATMAELVSWKNARNDLMHAMADGTSPMEDIDTEAQKLSEDGERIAHDFCRRARLLKRNRSNVAVPAKPFPYK